MHRSSILLALCGALALAQVSFALPMVQLGPGAVGSWNYDNGTQTWVTDTNPFELMAFANSDTSGANGQFAWDAAGAADRIAYLVVSAIPMINSDLIDITVMNDGGALPVFDSGFGAPPVQDDNSLSPHNIFDTYFEIYQFDFDGLIVGITDQQPGVSGTGDGYEESFDITINSLLAPVTGVHMDLFVVEGDGTYDPNAPANSNKKLVVAAAPFSHDAEYEPEQLIPEPGSLILALGAVGLMTIQRRARRHL